MKLKRRAWRKNPLNHRAFFEIKLMDQYKSKWEKEDTN